MRPGIWSDCNGERPLRPSWRKKLRILEVLPPDTIAAAVAEGEWKTTLRRWPLTTMGAEEAVETTAREMSRTEAPLHAAAVAGCTLLRSGSST
jgi:hypothetical protein